MNQICSLNLKHWIRVFPFVWFGFSLIAREFQTSSTAIYFNAVYYWVLFAFYIMTKQFEFTKLSQNWKNGKKFWGGVFLTFIGMLLAYIIGMLPSMLSGADDGLVSYRIDTPQALFLFAITLIPLPSIVEESFFRQNMISFKSNSATVATVIISSVLFGISHTFNPIGVFSGFMWGIPLAFSYIKREIYMFQ